MLEFLGRRSCTISLSSQKEYAYSGQFIDHRKVDHDDNNEKRWRTTTITTIDNFLMVHLHCDARSAAHLKDLSSSIHVPTGYPIRFILDRSQDSPQQSTSAISFIAFTSFNNFNTTLLMTSTYQSMRNTRILATTITRECKHFSLLFLLR